MLQHLILASMVFVMVVGCLNSDRIRDIKIFGITITFYENRQDTH